MPKYDLKTPLEVASAAKAANDYASRERNQNSYNTAWLHGYAYALKEVAEQQQQYAQEHSDTKILREILTLAEAELNENGSIRYTMPDGKHHIYIYVDFPEEESRLYIIEPNRVIDGAHEPMGDTAAAEYNSFSDLSVGCLWCIEQFRNDIVPERSAEKVVEGPLTADDLVLDDELFVDDVFYAKVEGYLWATDVLVAKMKEVVRNDLTPEALATAENINFYPVYDLRNAKVHIEGTFWYFDGHEEQQASFIISLSEEEQALVGKAMENHCDKHYHMTCEKLVNEVRSSEGIGSKVSLDEKIKAAQEQSIGGNPIAIGNQKTPEPGR